MAKFLVQGKYTAQGAAGLLREGGSSRKAAVEQVMESLGGTMEACYFALGDVDVFVIVDMPDTVSAVAVSLAVASSGAVGLSTVQLLTPEEMDQACKRTVDYRPPGAG